MPSTPIDVHDMATDMHESAPDLRTPDQKRQQRADYAQAIARATELDRRGRIERWSPERRWGERLPGATRQWASAEALADYLAGEWSYWTGHTPTAEERTTIDRTARTMWAGRASERVAPTHPPEGIRFAVCAFSPCRRQYDDTKGFGVFCSRSCMIDEANNPGTFAPPVPLVDEDDAAGVA